MQSGLLSHNDRMRLDDMLLGPLLAEVAATSSDHRKAAAKRAGGGYWGVLEVSKNRWRMQFRRKGGVHVDTFHASAEEAARAWDALAWEHDSWCAPALCYMSAALPARPMPVRW